MHRGPVDGIGFMVAAVVYFVVTAGTLAVDLIGKE